jgi:hypothetical protein
MLKITMTIEPFSASESRSMLSDDVLSTLIQAVTRALSTRLEDPATRAPVEPVTRQPPDEPIPAEIPIQPLVTPWSMDTLTGAAFRALVKGGRRVATVTRQAPSELWFAPGLPIQPSASRDEVMWHVDKLLEKHFVLDGPAVQRAEATGDGGTASGNDALVEAGMGALSALCRQWVVNMDVPDAVQPDRQSLLMGAFAGYGKAISAYVRERGGLAGACIDAIVRTGLRAPDDAALLGKRVALAMVQVGSALALPLDMLLERSLLLARHEDLATAPLTGGPAGDSIDFSRGEYRTPMGSN